MKNSELRLLASNYEHALEHLALQGKISITDIPRKYRKTSFSIYVASIRVARYNEEEHAKVLRVLFEDYDCLLKKDKPIFRSLIESEVNYNKGLIEKYELKLPRDYLAELAQYERG